MHSIATQLPSTAAGYLGHTHSSAMRTKYRTRSRTDTIRVSADAIHGRKSSTDLQYRRMSVNTETTVRPPLSPAFCDLAGQLLDGECGRPYFIVWPLMHLSTGDYVLHSQKPDICRHALPHGTRGIPRQLSEIRVDHYIHQLDK